MKFSYTALTSDNQKTTGVLDVANMAEAQAELHKMGAVILSLSEITDADYERFKNESTKESKQEGIRTFFFTALNPQQKEIKGTIDADDEFSAYKRLSLEYHFKVSELYPSGVTENQRPFYKNQLGEFEQRIAPLRKKEINETENAEQEELLNRQLIDGVDQMIKNVKEGLSLHGALFSAEQLSTIHHKLSELERIRTSNNIHHVSELSRQLYELIQSPDQVNTKTQYTDYQHFVHQIKDNQLIARESDLYSRAVELTGAKNWFKKVSRYFKNASDSTSGTDTSSKSSFLSSLFSSKKRKKEFIANTGKETAVSEKKTGMLNETSSLKEGVSNRDFTFLFIEIDSFIAWLLAFYIIYFFLVDFAIEKNMGLNHQFVIKTISNPLILNITFLLLISHFMLRIRNLHLAHRPFANLFLFFLTVGIYLLVIINF